MVDQPPKRALRGCGTAIVTPFLKTGEPDLEAFRRLVKRQLDAGIDFLVPCGTTGESVTLREEEYRLVIETAVETVAGRVPVVVGAGTNDTAHARDLAALAEASGADLILSVTPYYNKPSQAGLIEHFRSIADAITIPMVLYNVPGRTGANLLPETVFKLSEHPRIVAVKEASGNLGQIMTILAGRDEGFCVLSGDDDICLAVTAMGGDGVISVASNLIPGEMGEMIRLGLGGAMAQAREIHYRFLKLMRLNFVEGNPIPVKYALFRMGLIQEVYRLPLYPLGQEHRARLDLELETLGLISVHA